MSILLKYDNDGKNSTISDPSLEDIKDCINAMDNETRTGFTLDLPSGILALAGGNHDRVLVSFNGRRIGKDFRWGRLIDPQYVGSNEEIAISVEGEINHEPLHQTVSKEMAYQAASFFLLHDSFPEDMLWEGKMQKPG